MSRIDHLSRPFLHKNPILGFFCCSVAKEAWQCIEPTNRWLPKVLDWVLLYFMCVCWVCGVYACTHNLLAVHQ